MPDLPVEVITADFQIGEQPFWFGPPGTRIPVAGTFAIPGPPRDKPDDAGTGGLAPGNFYDEQEPFFGQLDQKTMRSRAGAYTTRWMELLRGVDPYTHSQNDPLHMPPITDKIEWEWGAFNLTAGAQVELNITHTDLIRMNNLVHGNPQ